MHLDARSCQALSCSEPQHIRQRLGDSARLPLHKYRELHALALLDAMLRVEDHIRNFTSELPRG
jgi:hypothetical protein